MTSLGSIQTRPRDLQPLLEALNQKVQAKSVEVRSLETKVSGYVQQTEAEAWFAAQNRKFGKEEALRSLIEQVAPEQSFEIRSGWEEHRRLASAVTSFQSLCKQLSVANQREQEIALPTVSNQQLNVRLGMLRDLETVAQALKSAGVSAAVGQFPTAQLALLRDNLSEQIGILKKAAPYAPPKLLSPKDVTTAEQAGAALGKLLGDEALGRALAASVNKAKDPQTYTQNLAAFTLLVDQASSAPDYTMTRQGWHYPKSRQDYRARAFDNGVVYLSENRLENSHSQALKVARELVNSAQPDGLLEKSLVDRFVFEIGASQRRTADWKPTAAGVREALNREALVPLRALNETVQDMAAKHRHYDEFRSVVDNVTKAVVEGNYREWRYTNPASKDQLKVLSNAQQEAWMNTKVSAEFEAPHGGKLKTREEDGVDLLWLTKIGGPSHGFDYGGHCLMPLLANARTKAIVVEDSLWPNNPAARAYLRLVSTPEGQPVLYLEPLQRDFPHRDRFKDRGLDTYFEAALLETAVKKAAALGVPLSIGGWLKPLAEQLGYNSEPDDRPVFMLGRSGGVLEASDTLTRLHDWVQTETQKVEPHERRLTILPGKE